MPADEGINRTKLIQLITENIAYNDTLEPQNEQKYCLKLTSLQIESLPSESIELIRDSIERLSLQKNQLSSLPSNFSNLQNLKYLDIHKNNFIIFPKILTCLSQLEILDISFNEIVQLDDSFDFGYLKKNLKIISLKANKLTKIPKALASLKNLKFLEIDENPLNEKQFQLLREMKTIESNEEWLKQLKTHLINEPDIDHNNHAVDDDEISDHRQPKHLERSRSTSDSYVSSRAAKRMGFIINRPNADLAADVIQEHPYKSTTTKSEQPAPSRNRSMTTTRATMGPPLDFKAQEPQSPEEGTIRKLTTFPIIKSPLSMSPKTDFKILEVAKKINIAISEFQSTLEKVSYILSTDRISKQSEVLVPAIRSSHQNLSSKINEFETDSKTMPVDELLSSTVAVVNAFKKAVEFLETHLTVNLKLNEGLAPIRSVFMSLFLSYSEVINAMKIIAPDQIQMSGTAQIATTQSNLGAQPKLRQLPPLRIPDVQNSIAQQQLNEYNDVDEKLYESLRSLLNVSSQVYAELNDAIAKSAIANAKQVSYENDDINTNDSQGGHAFPSPLISKIKDLTNTCVTSMELNKKIKLKLGNQSVKNHTIQEKKKFYDEINSFLKSIITILGSTKSIMNESVILNEVRQSFANLTKSTKDVTIVLEMSSYRMINDTVQKDNISISAVPQSTTTSQPPMSAIQPPMLSSIPSVMSIPQMNTPFLGMSSGSASAAGKSQFHIQPQQQQHASQSQYQGANQPLTSTPSAQVQSANPFEASMMHNLQIQSEGIPEE